MLHRPLIQRYAHQWLWDNKMWLVEPAPGYVPTEAEIVPDWQWLQRKRFGNRKH